jgi:hypothetical protein
MSEGMMIKKGGKLFETKWVYDDELEQGSYVETEITDRAYKKMWELYTLDEGVTLRDVLLLTKEHIEIFDLVIGNWCEELVDEGLVDPVPEFEKGDWSVLEKLELYWHFEEDHDDGTFSGLEFPSFHGTGYKTEDSQAVNLAVEFTPVYELVDVPLVLRPLAWIAPGHEETMACHYANETVPTREREVKYTLGDILYGIYWELSFCGSPVQRAAAKDHLDEVIAESKVLMTLSDEELDKACESGEVRELDVEIDPVEGDEDPTAEITPPSKRYLSFKTEIPKPDDYPDPTDTECADADIPSVDIDKLASESDAEIPPAAMATFTDEQFAEKMLAVAAEYLGVSRASDIDQVAKFLNLFGLPTKLNGAWVPFCAAGISYAAAKAYCDLSGIAYTEQNSIAVFRKVLPTIRERWFLPSPSCLAIRDYARSKKRWLQAKYSTSVKPGFLIEYNWEGGSTPHHVGTVVKAGTQVVNTIEFNTSAANNSNGGTVSKRTRNYNSVVGYVRTH